MSGMDFSPPSYRAASSDLTISISPLGLVELADEEFEVHGPRLNRYSLNWAMYLGHHYSYRRQTGETQMMLNYYRAFSDFLINFTFGKGVNFRSPKETEAIVPDLLERVWEVDNNKATVLWEIGQQGTVSGDCFIKVAYEEAYVDPAGRQHPGRVRILPLNSSFCFPEFHPHDRERLVRFKLKYRFWGCVDTETEALTRSGWKRYDELVDGDEILTLDPNTDEIQWKSALINIYDYSGHMVQWSNHINAVSTPNHRWLVEKQVGRNDTLAYERQIARTEIGIDGDPSISDLRNGSRIIVGGGTPRAFSTTKTIEDEVVETLAWYICEGNDHTNQNGYRSGRISQSSIVYPEKTERIRTLAKWWRDTKGASFSEGVIKPRGVVEFYLGKGTFGVLDTLAPNKEITPELITSLTAEQASLFYETLLDADGCRTHGDKKTTRWTQLDAGRKDSFQMLAAMLGIRSNITSDNEKVQVYSKRHILSDYTSASAQRVYLEDGKIWCPTVDGGIWFARREGSTYWTGNTSLEGTRQVFTYTEILTDDVIEEYINDELIDSRPNPLGTIPVIHIPNVRISGSPWGLSDCNDIININRAYNETATDIADIVNYHAAPVTVIIGAKASQLEKGANKVWGGLPKDARVENLEGGAQGLKGAMEFMAMMKKSMHEMIGVPETALGQAQPISNTSGVALSIQFQPLMNRYHQKIIQYSHGLERVNELILLNLALKEPETFIWDPNSSTTPLKQGQLSQLDVNDPLTFRSYVHVPQPLPLDKLIALNEIQSKLSLGLESKEGALRSLGEEFPAEKLTEIRQELQDDALADGALKLIQTQIEQDILALTGAQPGAAGAPSTPMGGPGAPGGDVPMTPTEPVVLDEATIAAQMGDQGVRARLVTDAYGTKLPQRRVPQDYEK